jgi:hypothetical protein
MFWCMAEREKKPQQSHKFLAKIAGLARRWLAGSVHQQVLSMGGCPVAVVCETSGRVTVVFEKPGRLGVSFSIGGPEAAHPSAITITSISENLATAVPALGLGMVLAQVQGREVAGVEFDDVIGLIKTTPRPLELVLHPAPALVGAAGAEVGQGEAGGPSAATVHEERVHGDAVAATGTDDELGRSELMVAAAVGPEACARALLCAGPTVCDAQDHEGWTGAKGCCCWCC